MLSTEPLVFNRSKDKLNKLDEDFCIEIAQDINILKSVDVLINATSIGLGKSDVFPIDNEFLKNVSYVFDMVYGKTDLTKRAKDFEVQVIGGKEMLLNQAIQQFKIFTGLDAPIQVMGKTISEGI